MTPEDNTSYQDSDEENSALCCHRGGCIRKEELNPPPVEKSESVDALYMVPTDHGWAWVICAGCFTMTFIMSLYDQVLAVMYVDVVEKFDVSTTVAALVFTIHAFTFSAGSIISTNVIIPKFDDRTVIVIAAIINSISTIIIAFSPNIAFYLVFHLFKGLSIGSMWIPALGLLGHYFNRRRSLASTITNAGIGVSLLITPPFVRELLDNFGFRGTLLIISGVEMQAIAIGMLLRPPSLYTHHRINTPTDLRPSHDKTDQKELCSLLENRERQFNLDFSDPVMDAVTDTGQLPSNCYTGRLGKPGNSNSVSQFEGQINQDSSTRQNNPVSQFHDHISHDTTTSQNSQQTYTMSTHTDDHSTENLTETFLTSADSNKQTSKTEQISMLPKSLHGEQVKCRDINNYKSNNSLDSLPVCSSTIPDKGQYHVTEKSAFQPQKKLVFWQTCCEALSRIFDFRLLSDWMMRLLLVSTALGALLVYIPAYIPTLAVRRGVTKSSAAILLTVCGGVNLISSLIQGFVIDCKLITASKFIVIAQVVVGTMCHLTHFFTSFPTLILLSVTQGMFGGARMSLMPVLAMDFVGVANLSKALGFNAMMATLSLSMHHPFLGHLLEVTNSFAVPFHYVGFALYISAGLMLLEPCARNLNGTRKSHRQSELLQVSKATG